MSAERPSVLLVTGGYAPEINSGGLQCAMVARALRDRVEFRVLTTALDASLPPRGIVDGVAVSRVAVRGVGAGSNLPAAPRMVAELARLVRRAHVVHVHGYSQKAIVTTAIARLFRVPVVLSLYTAGFDEPDTIARGGALARWAFSAASVWMPVSPGLRDACASWGVPRDRLHYVPNGVDIDRFRPASIDERRTLRRTLGIPEDRPVVLFVGYFSRDKQPHVLFDAWLQTQQGTAPPSTLVFVGSTRSTYFEIDERLAPAIRESARRADVADRLRFVPPTPRVEDYFRAADVFVLPSIREALPVALLEAMATSLPAVASRLPGSTDGLVDDGRTGLLAEPGDVQGFATALGQLIADGNRARAMGRAARVRIEQDFSADSTARGWLTAYRGVSAKFA